MGRQLRILKNVNSESKHLEEERRKKMDDKERDGDYDATDDLKISQCGTFNDRKS